MEKFHTIFKYDITPNDVDMNMRCRIVALERILLFAGADATEQHACGTVMLHENGYAWVLLKVAIEMIKYPKMNQTIYVDTWVDDVSRLLTGRNYIVRDADGEELCRSHTEWTLLDLNSRRPVDIAGKTKTVDFAVNDGPVVPKCPKIAPFEPIEVKKHTVCYSDLDYNNHTNSMQYLQWMLDACPLSFHQERTIKRLEIVYMYEVMHGETVNVAYLDRENETLFAVKAIDGTKDHVRARVEWK
ncbi:MAG: hypothetical protein HUJ90_05045 [Bacteroidales bacterium]|nr:hypothetical protein [Bacteroidales bacterium]